MAGKTLEGANRTRFLLGGASEAERERIEAELFADDDAFQEMLTAEDDLIDDYARGELSADERKQFEGRFLTSSEGCERVHFARAFAAANSPRPVTATREVATPGSPGVWALIFGRMGFLQPALATISVVAIIGISWLLVERSRLNRELNALRTERSTLDQKMQGLQQTADSERRQSVETMAELNDLRARLGTESTQPSKDTPQPKTPRKGAVDSGNNETLANNRRNTAPAEDSVTFDLEPGSVRSGSGAAFKVPTAARYIRLRIAVDGNSPEQRYRAVIETPEARKVWSSDVFKGVGSGGDTTSVLRVPSRNLPPGHYVMSLQAERPNGVFEHVTYYSFRVARK